MESGDRSFIVSNVQVKEKDQVGPRDAQGTAGRSEGMGAAMSLRTSELFCTNSLVERLRKKKKKLLVVASESGRVEPPGVKERGGAEDLDTEQQGGGCPGEVASKRSHIFNTSGVNCSRTQEQSRLENSPGPSHPRLRDLQNEEGEPDSNTHNRKGLQTDLVEGIPKKEGRMADPLFTQKLASKCRRIKQMIQRRSS